MVAQAESRDAGAATKRPVAEEDALDSLTERRPSLDGPEVALQMIDECGQVSRPFSSPPNVPLLSCGRIRKPECTR